MVGMAGMRNILVVKLRYIGDVLLATPVLRALREYFPSSRLTVAVNRGTEDILKWNPDVDEVFIVERSLWSQARLLADVRRRRFELAIDLTDADRSAFLSWWTRAPQRIGFNAEHRWRGALYTTVVPSPRSIHRIERNLTALRPLGVEPKARVPVLHTSAVENDQASRILQETGAVQDQAGIDPPLVMIHPGARYWFKAWPAERFAALLDRLNQAYGCRFLIGGSSQERPVAAAIVRQTRCKPIDLTGRVDLLAFAAILRRCALFVGNDNGPMHMAAAVGTPVVGLFGPSNPQEWGPRGERAIVLYKHVDCRKCFHPTCRRGDENCMRQISVDEVFDAASRCLTAKEGVDAGS